MNSIIFTILSISMVFGAILSIFSRSVVHSLLWAMVSFISVSGLFLNLGATYNAIIQLLIYVGAIPILIAAAIMLTKSTDSGYNITRKIRLIYSLVGIMILCIILGEFIYVNKDFYLTIHQCSVYINSYSDIISITKNIYENHFILLVEFGLGVLLTVIGVNHYEK